MSPVARIVALLLLLAIVFCAGRTSAASLAAIPEPFTLFLSAPGVSVYGNESELDAEEYVQIVDLSAGARLAFWHGAILDAGTRQGQYGGASPRIERHYLPDVWLTLASAYPSMLCLANGQFFRDTINGMWVNPTELAFPLKSDGVVVSEGYEGRRYRWQRTMLEIWKDRAAIRTFSRHAFYTSTAPNIIVGLDEHAHVRATEALGRTLVGVSDGDGDGLQERLYVYSAAASTQSHAAAVLREFGAQSIMMLDGGGSAQLSCEGVSYIRRVRPLPQMMATIPASTRTAPPPDPYLKFFEEALSRWLRRLEIRP